MTVKSGVKAYGQVQSQADASPYRIVQMLMQGMLDKLAIAKGHMARGEIEEKGAQISTVIEIIGVLQNSLDVKVGGEAAENLIALYEYMTRQLLVANKDNNPEILDEIGQLVAKIKSGWDGIPPDEHNPPGLEAG